MEMKRNKITTSRQGESRRAGLLYLAFVITCIFAGIVRSNLIVYDDAAKTAGLLEHSMWLLRISFVDDLVSAVLFLLAAWALYGLLKPVHDHIALLFLLLNVAGVAVQCLSLLFLSVPLLIGGNGDLGNAFQPGQLDNINLLFLNLYKSGFTIAQIFFGAWLLPLGYLVYKSGFLPKWLGILLMADCAGCLLWFFQFFLLPGYDIITYPGLAVGFVAEFALSLWLIFMGGKGFKMENRNSSLVGFGRPHEFYKELSVLTIGGGAVFWATTIVTSLLPLAAEYRAAFSNWSIQTVWVDSLPMGLMLGCFVSYILLRFFGKLSSKRPIPTALAISAVALAIAIALVDVPMMLHGSNDALEYFLIGVGFNAARFLLLGLTVGSLYKKLIQF